MWKSRLEIKKLGHLTKTAFLERCSKSFKLPYRCIPVYQAIANRAYFASLMEIYLAPRMAYECSIWVWTLWILMRPRKWLRTWLQPWYEQFLLLSMSSSSVINHSELDKHSSSCGKSLYADHNFTAKKLSSQRFYLLSCIPETQSAQLTSTRSRAVVQGKLQESF